MVNHLLDMVTINHDCHDRELVGGKRYSISTTRAEILVLDIRLRRQSDFDLY